MTAAAVTIEVESHPSDLPEPDHIMWGWRLLDPSGVEIAAGSGYATEEEATRMAEAVRDNGIA